MNYSIIIPIYNESDSIPYLLKSIKQYSLLGHEIIIIDDGSNDGGTKQLRNNNFIKLLELEKNKGKGFAIKEGLNTAKYNRIIIFDGDMELDISNISRLMILDKKSKIHSVMGIRFNNLTPLKSNFDWGNFMFTSFFNIIFKSNHKDILCCAKAFYLDEIQKDKIKSDKFDIDVELSTMLTINNSFIPQIELNYKRRSIEEGKKLIISDGWSILFRIIKMIKYL